MYRQTNLAPYPVPDFPVILIVSMIWLIAGAIALCMRQPWGRVMVLTILIAGCLSFFVNIVAILGDAAGSVAARIEPLLLAIVIYFVAILFINNSRHIRRLTSRVWE
jgi:hypothetical protein